MQHQTPKNIKPNKKKIQNIICFKADNSAYKISNKLFNITNNQRKTKQKLQESNTKLSSDVVMRRGKEMGLGRGPQHVT